MSIRTLLPLLLVACGPAAPMSSAADTSSSSTPDATSTPPTTSSEPPQTSTTSELETTQVSTSTSTSTSTDTTDPELTFLLPFDFSCLAAPGPRSARCSQCDLFSQDCPEGHKCVAYADDGGEQLNNNKCVPLDPDPDHVGEPCTVEGNPTSGIDSCDRETACWKVDADTLTGTCVAFCGGSPEAPQCAAGTTCGIFNDGTIALCLATCDPLAQDCQADEVCIASTSTDAFLCTTDASGDAGAVFDACTSINACDPGLLCVPPSSAAGCDQDAAGCCTPWCDTTLPPNCPEPEQLCQPFFADPPPELMHIGVCSLP